MLTIRDRAPRTGDARQLTLLAVGAWAALVVAALVWGSIAVADRGLGLGAAPLVGTWSWHPGPGLLGAVALAAAVVGLGPPLARSVRWPVLAAGTGLLAVGWAVALAAADGRNALSAPLTSRYEYEPFAATIDDPIGFVRGFTEGIATYPTHVKSHPPFATLVPWVLDRIGLGGAGWFAVLVVVSWGVAVVAALAALRSVAGEQAARMAAPALVLLPAAVWAATSADALFAGVLAVGVALSVGTGTRRLAVGGAVLGCGLLLTYGGVLLLVVPAVAALWRRRPVNLVPVVVGVAAVVLLAAALGFWWLDGLAAARGQYWAGAASSRPSWYLAIAGNPAALALATGPAVAVGLAHLGARKRSAVALLPLAVLAAVALANLSLLSKGEVERIWLPFVPWLALAAPGNERPLLVAQATTGIVIQAWLVTPW